MREYSKEYNQLTRVLNEFFWTYKKESDEEDSLYENEAQNELIKSSEHYTNEIKSVFKKYGVMLCGGTINSIFSSRNVNDLDLYLKSDDNHQISDLTKKLEETYNYKRVFTSNNAITLRRKGANGKIYEIQIITRFIGTPLEILDTFDFTIVQGLFDFQENSFIVSDRFLIDIAKRKLEYTNTSQYPICALYRTKKYVERGYTISGANLVALSLSIHALKLETYKDLKDQLMGIDTSMMAELDARLSKDGDIDSKAFELSEFIRDWYDLMLNYMDDGL